MNDVPCKGKKASKKWKQKYVVDGVYVKKRAKPKHYYGTVLLRFVHRCVRSCLRIERRVQLGPFLLEIGILLLLPFLIS